jgi:hypothetical protein
MARAPKIIENKEIATENTVELPAAGAGRANDVAVEALKAIADAGNRKRDAFGRHIAYRPDPELMARIARDALEKILAK